MFVLLGIGALAAAKVAYDHRNKPDYDDEDGQSESRPQPILQEIKLPTPKRPSARAWSSPLQGVTDSQWQQFCRKMGDPKNVNSISESGHIGFFRFSCPRLQELGYAVAARRTEPAKPGGKRPWTADLLDAGFLQSGRSQLGAFELSCGDLASKIKAANLLDARPEIDGQRATLSGLLAVAHRAGFKGLQSWMKHPPDRVRYPNTTKAFKDANGVF
jgi:hypothetical protein